MSFHCPLLFYFPLPLLQCPWHAANFRVVDNVVGFDMETSPNISCTDSCSETLPHHALQYIDKGYYH